MPTNQITGHSEAPHPAATDTWSLVMDGTGGTVKFRTTYHQGPSATPTNADSATFAPTATAATLQTALRALPGFAAATVTGGVGAAGGGTPYVITLGATDKNGVTLAMTANAITGGAATAVLAQSLWVTKIQSDNTTVNRQAGDAPTSPGGAPLHTHVADKQYGQTPYSPVDKAAAVAAKDAANALAATAGSQANASAITGHTTSIGQSAKPNGTRK